MRHKRSESRLCAAADMCAARKGSVKLVVWRVSRLLGRLGRGCEGREGCVVVGGAGGSRLSMMKLCSGLECISIVGPRPCFGWGCCLRR